MSIFELASLLFYIFVVLVVLPLIILSIVLWKPALAAYRHHLEMKEQEAIEDIYYSAYYDPYSDLDLSPEEIQEMDLVQSNTRKNAKMFASDPSKVGWVIRLHLKNQ